MSFALTSKIYHHSRRRRVSEGQCRKDSVRRAAKVDVRCTSGYLRLVIRYRPPCRWPKFAPDTSRKLRSGFASASNPRGETQLHWVLNPAAKGLVFGDEDCEKSDSSSVESVLVAVDQSRTISFEGNLFESTCSCRTQVWTSLVWMNAQWRSLMGRDLCLCGGRPSCLCRYGRRPYLDRVRRNFQLLNSYW
jgi:hypothetical protein